MNASTATSVLSTTSVWVVLPTVTGQGVKHFTHYALLLASSVSLPSSGPRACGLRVTNSELQSCHEDGNILPHVASVLCTKCLKEHIIVKSYTSMSVRMFHSSHHLMDTGKIWCRQQSCWSHVTLVLICALKRLLSVSMK
jgi:hypothetical protein